MVTAFGYSAKDTNIVVDQLAKTQSIFNTNIEQTFEAMKYLIPAANGLKIPMSEANAVIGLMASSGLKGSISTRAMATSMMGLAKPTKTTSDALRALNVDLFTSEGKYIGIANTISKLNKSMEGLSDKSRVAAISSIFGPMAVKSWDILLKSGGDTIKKFTKVIEGSKGAAKQMAEIRQRGLLGGFTEFKSAIEFSLIEFSTPILKDLTVAFRDMASSIRSITVAYRNLNPMLKKFIAYTTGIVLAIAPVLLVLAGFVMVIKAIAIGVAPLILGFKLLLPVIGSVITGTKLLAAGMVTIGTLTAGFTAAAAAAYVLYQAVYKLTTLFLGSKKVTGKVSSSGETIKALGGEWKAGIPGGGLSQVELKQLIQRNKERREADKQASLNVNSSVNLTGVPVGMNASITTSAKSSNLGMSMGY